MKIAIVGSTNASRFDTLSPELFVSGAFDEIKNLSDTEIKENAAKLLKETPDYVRKHALKILKSTQDKFPTDIIEARRALSSTSYMVLLEAIKEKQIPIGAKQKLAVATAVHGVLSIFGGQDFLKKEATDQREELLEKLDEIESFLNFREESELLTQNQGSSVKNS